MERQERIQREIERTLAYLDQPEPITPTPHFCARVMARIRECGSAKPIFNVRMLLVRLAMVSAALALLTAVNLFSLKCMTDSRTTNDPERETVIRAIAQDYSFAGTADDYFPPDGR